MADDPKQVKRRFRFPILPTPMLDPAHPGRLTLSGRLFLEGSHPGGGMSLEKLELEPTHPGVTQYLKERFTDPHHPRGLPITQVRFTDPPHPEQVMLSKEYVLDTAVKVKRIFVETDKDGRHYLALEEEE